MRETSTPRQRRIVPRFVHEAQHGGSEDRFILLLDMPHPDLAL